MDVRVNVALLMTWSAVAGLAFVAFRRVHPDDGVELDRWLGASGLRPFGALLVE